jgi:hypothetical protein
MAVRSNVLALAALLGVLGGAPAGAGNLLYVDDDGLDGFNCTNAPYTTISAAVAAAKQGDQIRVCPGTYVEQVVVPFDMTIRGEAFGSRRAVIKPTAMPATLPTIDGGNPVAAAILNDGHVLRMSDVDIDLADNTVAGCSPVLAGIYVRNGWAAIERLEIANAVVNGRPDCDSGIGILVESGIREILFGRPIFGKSRFIAKTLDFEGFQKAGVVATGPKTVVRLEGGEATTAAGADGAAVPYGYQLSNGARGKVLNATAKGITSATAGKLAAGILASESGKVTFRRAVLQENEVGVFVVGDNARIKRNTFMDHTSDAIVLIGDSNLVTSADVHGASVAGCFVVGDHNVVRGGFYGGAPIGIWFLSGIGNAFYGITWGEVPLETRGVYGGLRDVGADDAAPFSTRCTSALACDDGNECTTDVCTLATGACSSTPVADGTACAGGTCTAGTCS